jgi:truncated hemoglobin YjbI
VNLRWSTWVGNPLRKHDEHAGGDEGLHRLEAIFYAKALADPVLKHSATALLCAR